MSFISKIGMDRSFFGQNSTSKANFLIGILSSVVIIVAPPTLASAASCDQLYPAQVQPRILKESLNQKTEILCYEEFSLLHSGIAKTSLWTAQHLTADGIAAAETVDREDVFHADSRIAPQNRAELEDYRRSGYDRGHMAPAADMTSVKAQDESFSLANMVPQLPELNRGMWSRMESTTRNLAKQYGEVYVVTGPAFIGKNLKRLNGRVFVPTHTYKAVYLPTVKQAGVWWAENSGKGTSYEVISVDELSARTGVDVFPGLSEQVKATAVQLPEPKAYSNRNGVAKTQPSSDHAPTQSKVPPVSEPTWLDYGFAILERLLK